MNTNKWIKSGLAGLMLSAGVALAADNEVNVSSDTSRNPITGTVTVKKKYNRKHRNAVGGKSTAKHVRTTKYKTDGSVEQKTQSSQAGEKSE